MYKTTVNIGEKVISITVKKIKSDEIPDKISRVYVLAFDDDGNVPLIFNSKRKIWGFPGGHTGEGETIEQTAYREFAEEVNRELIEGNKRFLIINKIDDDKEENQIICFGKVGDKKTDITDEEESVSEVSFVPIQDVISHIGNTQLWGPIVGELRKEFESSR